MPALNTEVSTERGAAQGFTMVTFVRLPVLSNHALIVTLFKPSGSFALISIGFLVAPRPCFPIAQHREHQHEEAAHCRCYQKENYHDAIVHGCLLFFLLFSLILDAGMILWIFLIRPQPLIGVAGKIA
jgi:hypothetical protein